MELSQIFTADPLRTRPRRMFLKDAVNHLSPNDQTLFEQFGQGPIIAPSYSFIHHAIEDYAIKQPNTNSDKYVYYNLNC